MVAVPTVRSALTASPNLADAQAAEYGVGMLRRLCVAAANKGPLMTALPDVLTVMAAHRKTAPVAEEGLWFMHGLSVAEDNKV
jgi:hypothetical protein